MFHIALGLDICLFFHFTNNLVDVRLCFGREMCTISVRIQVNYLEVTQVKAFSFIKAEWRITFQIHEQSTNHISLIKQA